MQILVAGADHSVGGAVSEGLRATEQWPVLALPLDGLATSESARNKVNAATGGDPLDGLVLAAWAPSLSTPRSIESLSDADISAGWEASMQTMIWTLQACFAALSTRPGRVVVLLPTTGMSGGHSYALAASVFEAQRVLAKATARQWGPHGIRVNTVAISPELVLDDADRADVHYLAPPAFTAGTGDVVSTVAFLLGPRCGVTGQTITADGGRWLP